MKKVLVAVALVMGLGSSVAFAQEVENSTAVETQAQAPQDEFTKIDAKKLPDAVMNALAKSYEGASIKEVYSADKETGKIYNQRFSGSYRTTGRKGRRDKRGITKTLNAKNQ